jgi:hypothetical protein
MEIPLLLIAPIWLLILATVSSLCLAARSGDRQQIVLDELQRDVTTPVRQAAVAARQAA